MGPFLLKNIYKKDLYPFVLVIKQIGKNNEEPIYIVRWTYSEGIITSAAYKTLKGAQKQIEIMREAIENISKSHDITQKEKYE